MLRLGRIIITKEGLLYALGVPPEKEFYYNYRKYFFGGVHQFVIVARTQKEADKKARKKFREMQKEERAAMNTSCYAAAN